MNGLEKDFLQSIKNVEKITPYDVAVVENETLPPKHIQYCVNLGGEQFHIIVKKNGGEVLILGKGDDFPVDTILKLPHEKGYNQQEINLFYVACTRAKLNIQLPTEFEQVFNEALNDYEEEELDD